MQSLKEKKVSIDLINEDKSSESFVSKFDVKPGLLSESF